MTLAGRSADPHPANLLDDPGALRLAAATNGLASGRGLKLVEPGDRFRAAFGVAVHGADASNMP